MKSQALHTVQCYITGKAEGEIWTWSLLGVKGLIDLGVRASGQQCYRAKHDPSGEWLKSWKAINQSLLIYDLAGRLRAIELIQLKNQFAAVSKICPNLSPGVV